MSRMTAEEVRAWKDRWKLVNQREIEELRNTPVEKKFRQLVQLHEAGKRNGWLERSDEDLREIERVRAIWIKLKSNYR
ncbi:MAG: hypothetical protein K0Q72_1997 [Armatimonadetes bacterium]|jgi:hypothetical protein|nr:hypothetical protein [Armatimonadota bacterium]